MTLRYEAPGSVTEALPEPLPRVSILMPVRDEGSFLAECLEAVFAQDYPADLIEVLVADGMSVDGTRDIVSSFQQLHSNLFLIDNPQKTVPFGLNASTRQAHGDVLIRVDGHCVIARDYVRNCVRHLLLDGVEGVGGSVKTIGETGTAASIAIAMSSRFGVGGSAFRIFQDRDLLADTVPFAAYTRETVERAGPYDEEQARNQDDEYNYRIREMGGTLLLASDVKSRYYSRSSLKRLFRQYFEYGYWKVRVMQKHPQQMSLRQFIPPFFVGALVLLCLLTPLSRSARRIAFALGASYAAANIGASVQISRREGWCHLRVLPAAFAALHFGYGAGFLAGLMRFAGRWKKMTRFRGATKRTGGTYPIGHT